MLTIIWAFSESSYSNSNNEDHWSPKQMKIFKSWNIARITKMQHKDMKWKNADGKTATIDLLDVGLPQTFHL